MPKIKYIDKKISQARLDVIATANRIIAEYGAQGFALTLRQLYYQFVARDLIPNNDREYKQLGGIINDGRLLGLIDWIEKDAMAGVVEGICEELDVPYFSCRGYTSQSEMWVGAQRLRKYRHAEQTPYILHFGDHDPSGKDMTRDIEKRLRLFMGQHIEVERKALNWDQIERYSPPPNPAKLSDSRAKVYIAEFGDDSWELDALEPSVIVDLIRDSILEMRDVTEWGAKVEEEDTHRDLLGKASARWDDVVELLEKE